MAIELSGTGVGGLRDVLDVLRVWQRDEPAVHLHPGDLGWFWRFGAEATAAAVRTWSRDGRMLAVGLLDSPDLMRLTIAPEARQDIELAARLGDDLSDPARDVLPAGEVLLEAPMDARIQDLLLERSWEPDEAWSPLRRDLSASVEDAGIRIEVITAERSAVRAVVQRESFDHSTFSAQRWETMAGGPAYREARCLVAWEEAGKPVACVTVWSAGAGKPGLIEPMGVHRDHRGLGYGRAITLAAARALQDLGASSAIVGTPSSNVAAVATYRAAGFAQLDGVRDLRRA